jgi:hypothetical protein
VLLILHDEHYFKIWLKFSILYRGNNLDSKYLISYIIFLNILQNFNYTQINIEIWRGVLRTVLF